MRNNYLFILFLFTVFSVSAQQTADALITKVIKIRPRTLEKYNTRPKDNVVYLRTGFNDAIYTGTSELHALRDKVITKVELIYTTYRKSETFDQHALNRKRLKALIGAVPQLMTQPSVEWTLYAQTGCTSSEMGKEFFHGVAITYREPESEALRDAELRFLESVAAGTVPAYAYDAFIGHELKTAAADTTVPKIPPKIKMPEFVGGERARIDFFTRNLRYPASASGGPRQVAVQFVVDKQGRIQNISLPGTSSPTAYDEEVLRFVRTMPNWSPGSVGNNRVDCLVTFTVDFMDRGRIVPSPLEVYAMDAEIPSVPTFDYSRVKPTPQGRFVSETLANNTWKNAVLVCDVTGSMAPYNAQVLEFLKNRFAKRDTAIVSYLFFNDGDGKKNSAKRAGNVGGLYAAGNQSFEEVIVTMGAAMKGGTGGDLPENNIEALRKAEENCPSCACSILIADNIASPRDMSLLPELKKPVHVIVCGSSPILNEDYLNIARTTKGTLHFGNKSFADLHMFEEGATVQVLREVFVVKKGKFVRRD